MSSYQAEFQLVYQQGIEEAREIATKMYQDGYEKGLKEFREFDDKEKTVFYHVTKILSYLGVENPKVANAYKAYLIGEAEANA